MLPPELLILIIQSACSNDPFTARTLVSVSRTFYANSIPSMYNAVALHDADRVQVLAKSLQSKPHLASLVQHLFVSEAALVIDCTAFRQTLESLLGLVSPTLTSLTLLITTRDKRATSVFQTVFNTPFPRLISLTLCGNHPIPRSLKMPVLQRFHIAGLTKLNAANCFAPFTQACPRLSHIRISMALQHNLTCAISAALSLSGAPTSLERMFLEPTGVSSQGRVSSALFPSLPAGLVSLLIKPAAPLMILFPGYATVLYQQYAKQLEDLTSACPLGKIKLLPSFRRDLWEVDTYGVTQAKYDWIDSIKGGMGAWSVGSSLSQEIDEVIIGKTSSTMT